jgi:hypothetical protein
MPLVQHMLAVPLEKDHLGSLATCFQVHLITKRPISAVILITLKLA